MKFTLHRKPDSKAQKIPFPAMQIAGLADAEALVLRAEEGCILLARDSLSTREIVKVIAFLDEIVTSMAEQLAKKSDEMASLQEEDDPLNAFDEDEIDTLEQEYDRVCEKHADLWDKVDEAYFDLPDDYDFDNYDEAAFIRSLTFLTDAEKDALIADYNRLTEIDGRLCELYDSIWGNTGCESGICPL